MAKAAIPDFNTKAQDALASFAMDLAADGYSPIEIWHLRKNLKDNLPDDVKTSLVERLNKDPDAVIAEAKKKLKDNPELLAEINKNPQKIATVMGVKSAVPQPPAIEKVGTPAAELDKATPAAMVVEPAKEPTAAELKTQEEEFSLMAALRSKTGYKELVDRTQKDPALDQAFRSVMSVGVKGPQSDADMLRKMKGYADQDPEFFVKINKGLDEIPEQFREHAYEEIARDPELALGALTGNKEAKAEMESRVQQREISGMFGNLFGAGPDGKGGLSNLFGGEGMKGFGEMMQKIIPALLDMLKGIMENLMGGLQKLTQSNDLMRMGNNPEGTRNLALVAGQALGVEGGHQHVIDANDPNAPVVTAATLGAPKTEGDPQSPQRKLEVQQSVAPGLSG